MNLNCTVMIKRILLVSCFSSFYIYCSAQQLGWPAVKTEAKPAARWWWLGSAVDEKNLTFNLQEYSHAGMGTMEITPIYGVKSNEARDISFLSPAWMKMLRHTESEAKRLDMQMDMNTGTGWPFGGPEVSIEDAASKVLFEEYQLNGGERLNTNIQVSDEKQKSIATLYRLMAFSDNGQRKDITSKVDKQGKLNWIAPAGKWRLIAVFNGKTLQKVKRAAPGGEGYVMNHFSHKAVANYLNRFEKAFASTKTPYPHNFFNDSYEVYNADWTPDLLEQFYKRRGYKLEEYLPEFLNKNRNEITARIISDYRETIAELLQENFTSQWTNWAHSHGSMTRNQAHGSPGNLIDLYATVDVPECEGFGLSNFGIKGLRKDSLTLKNFSDLSMLKYASSAAHISGKPYTSAETFTWLTEHFRTSLSQCKPDIDLMFVSGINHTYFHGTPYSPQDAKWPGWLFYASINMSPTNTIWHDVPAFFQYITRCQSFLQMGKPDNDFLVYLPVYDMWNDVNGRLLQFDIHKMEKNAPKFIETVHKINQSGYDVDYISDNFIRNTKCVDGMLLTKGGVRYKAIIIPAVKKMPDDVLAHLISLAEQGAKIIFIENYPLDVPGFSKLEQRRSHFKNLLSLLPAAPDFKETICKSLKKGTVITGSDYLKTLAATGVVNEDMKTINGLNCIRRSNESGYHYFIASLQPKDVEGWINLGVKAVSAVIYNPLNGESGKAKIRQANGRTQVYVQIKSGESVILKTFTNDDVQMADWQYTVPQTVGLTIDNNWKLHFVQSKPEIDDVYNIGKLCSWTELNEPKAKVNMGTGVYSVNFNLPAIAAEEWVLDLGDVRESARVKINGKEVATLWSVPFTAKVGKFLKPGENKIEVEVTNLPANRIADYDRRGIEWRNFKEINLVDINYKSTKYGNWEVVPSGLLGPVKLIPVNLINK